MSMLPVLDVLGVVLVAGLVWYLVARHTADQLKTIEQQRRAESKLVGRADFVEGMQHFPVVLSLTDRDLKYENHDLQAQLDLERIEEVEYVHELATGKDVPNGTVLRLRSHGHTFEFIVDKTAADQWVVALPAHRMGGEAPRGQVLAH